MKKKLKKGQRKEEVAEDWCFVCKDGGMLLVCDYKKCLKSYHPSCVDKDDSFLETGEHWVCGWHSCVNCHKTPTFYCYCCPTAVCRRCSSSTEFALVKGRKGFCSNCLGLALLIEDNLDVDSDGERVDFKDRETYEGLFMEYYEIIKGEEGFTAENIYRAKARLKNYENCETDSDTSEFDGDQEIELISDKDDVDMPYKLGQKKKKKKKKNKCRKLGSLMKGKVSSNKKEFVGWGSKSLIEFLQSIGKDTSEKLSQYDVTSIVKEYIKENQLFQSNKKRKVICDQRLFSMFRRKTLNRHRIYDLLEDHYRENQEQMDEDEGICSADDEDINVQSLQTPFKRQRKPSKENNLHKKDIKLNMSELYFASIVAENIKHVYLKRSLVQELLKEPKTFECKLVGSFVRMKADPIDFSQRNSHQLVLVTGVTWIDGASTTKFCLRASDISEDICINMLSDDNFSEEECEVLRQKVKRGLLKRPTIVEFEQKAKSLHEDITKHWIAKELVLLQNLIDRANEKGWRSELFDYLERKRLLQKSSEQLRLLQNLPTIIPDLAEAEPHYKDIPDNKHVEEGSPKLLHMNGPYILQPEVETCKTFLEKGNHGGVSAVQQHVPQKSASGEELQHSHLSAPQVQQDICSPSPQEKMHLEATSEKTSHHYLSVSKNKARVPGAFDVERKEDRYKGIKMGIKSQRSTGCSLD